MVTAKAHGGTIDIQGVTVAQVDDKVRLQKVETWFDPMEMFRQIAPNGIVNKGVKKPKSGISVGEPLVAGEEKNDEATLPASIHSDAKRDTVTSSGNTIEKRLHAADQSEILPENALAVPPEVEQTKLTHEEMSEILPSECPFMNKE